MKPDPATKRQIEAANPTRSTWLTANAGSGKTRVLTDRVARLLYLGVPPQNILCLTYTKAAASEMQNRLFARLGKWTLLPAPQLEKEIANLGAEGPFTQKSLEQARTLFAKALETPGGLKIQTIHSFCAGLLRRFPLEAGVMYQFEEMDELRAKRLRENILENMALGPEVTVMREVFRFAGDHAIDALLARINTHRNLFEKEIDPERIRKAHGVTLNEPEILDRIFAPKDREMVRELLAVLPSGNGDDGKLRQTLAALNLTSPDLEDLKHLERRLLYASDGKDGNKGDPKRTRVITKATQKKVAHLLEAFWEMGARISKLRRARLALGAAQKSLALADFAHSFLTHYQAEKNARGILDFDDLIHRTQALLCNPEVAQWVLYRLDGGIDHILVDEAQDTSPIQWDVIERLSAEFTAGEGSATRDRSIFVVGDKKQSIFSFQGADPSGFSRMRENFAKRLEGIGQPLQNLELEHSFRSSIAILETVDRVFATERDALGQDARHKARYTALPGRVDLWPPIPQNTEDASDAWENPVDLLSSTHHFSRLARRIVDEMARMIGTWRPTLDENKNVVMTRIRPGDFMIILPRRSIDLFQELIRACKAAELPIAGSDQVNLSSELAVRDMLALLRFLSFAEDDLSLAEVLRSPLFGLSEQDLYTLAHGRRGTLWQALRTHSDMQAPREVLEDLRAHVDYLRPYELLDRMLTRHGGRRKLLSRLGPEVEEGIDVLLDQALNYENDHVPNIAGFIGWLEAGELQFKRTIDDSRNEIRIMTIHGAKGLEAPIVILPDTANRKAPPTPSVLADGEVAHWISGEPSLPQSTLIDAQRKTDEDERQRLLYVAMTRAQTWLIVAGAGDVDRNSWFQQIADGMDQLETQKHTFPTGLGLRYEPIAWEGPTANERSSEVVEKRQQPSWLTQPAPVFKTEVERRSPSALPGAKALAGETTGEDTTQAIERGREIHLLLEHLADAPAHKRAEIAAHLSPQGSALLPEVTRILQNPTLSHIFAPDTLAEVDISAHMANTDWLGIIDRLIVTEDKITAVDFKSNTIIPETAHAVPDGILAQMGAYAKALALIYPDREITTQILWTQTEQLMDLPANLVERAFQHAMELDALEPAT